LFVLLFYKEARYNYEKIKDYRDLDTSYDYNSIMHYADGSFGIDENQPTMRALKPPGFINPGEQLTQIDIDEIRKMYNCKATNNNNEDTIIQGSYSSKINCVIIQSDFF
jgi:hypothetical protein